MTARTLWPLAACMVASTCAQWADVGPATDAGYETVRSRPIRTADGNLIERYSLRMRNGPFVLVTATQAASASEIETIWSRFEGGMQLPPRNGVRSLKFRYSLGERFYLLDREGFSGWRLVGTLGTAYVELILHLPGHKSDRGMVFAPNDVVRDRLMMRQVAARTLANIASRELSGISDDPSTGAGRYARPDGARFVELTPWARAKGWSARLNDDGIAVTLAKADRTVVVNLASKDATVDGAKRTLSECPLWKGGRFLVAEKDLARLTP